MCTLKLDQLWGRDIGGLGGVRWVCHDSLHDLALLEKAVTGKGRLDEVSVCDRCSRTLLRIFGGRTVQGENTHLACGNLDFRIFVKATHST